MIECQFADCQSRRTDDKLVSTQDPGLLIKLNSVGSFGIFWGRHQDPESSFCLEIIGFSFRRWLRLVDILDS